MSFQHEIKPVPAAHSGFLKMLRSLRRTRRPVILTARGRPQAVLLDPDSYSVLREIALLIEVFEEGRARPGSARRGGSR